MATAHEDRKLSLTDKDDVAHIEKATASPPSSNEIIEDSALEARLNRKFDIHILPWLFGIWYVSISRFNPCATFFVSPAPVSHEHALSALTDRPGSSPSSTAPTLAMPTLPASPPNSASKAPSIMSPSSSFTSPISSLMCRRIGSSSGSAPGYTFLHSSRCGDWCARSWALRRVSRA